MKFYVFDFDVNKKKYFWVSRKNIMDIVGKNDIHLVIRGLVEPDIPINYKVQFGKEFDPFLTHM